MRKEILAQLFLAIVLIFLTIENISVLETRFSQLRITATENISTPSDLIVEEPISFTLEQQEKIAEYFHEQYERNGYPVLIETEPYWERSLKFLTERKGVPVASFSGVVYLHGNSFIVARSKKGVKSKLKKLAPFADLVEKKQFGTLTVYALSSKPETASTEDPKTPPLVDVISGDKPNIREAAKSGTVRITWRDILPK